MFNAFLHLLARSWANLMTRFSMSTLGFVAVLCLLPLVEYTALVVIPALLDRTPQKSFKNNLRRNK